MKIAYFFLTKCVNLEEEGSGQSRATLYEKISDFVVMFWTLECKFFEIGIFVLDLLVMILKKVSG